MFSPASAGHFPGIMGYSQVYIATLLATLVLTNVFGGYRLLRRQTVGRIVLASFMGPACGLAVLSSFFFTFRIPGYSRVLLFSYVVIGSAGLASYRLILRAISIWRWSRGRYTKQMAVVGSSNSVEHVAEILASAPYRNEFRLTGYFSLAEDESAACGLDGTPLRKLGSIYDLGKRLISVAIDELVVVLPENAEHGILDAILRTCDYFMVPVHIVPATLLGATLKDLHPRNSLFVGGLPGVSLVPDDTEGEVLDFKRILDIVVSATLLIILSPLFVLIAIAIKITTPSLPVFYPWRVVGYKGRRFTGYKFTTMVANADDLKEALQDRNEMSGPVFKIADDPRVTPLGRFLRKYSLNELPQFWSVLVGDMSLVGPRPAGPHELERYDLWHKRKLSIRPGITCLWQVRGRNMINNFDDWVRMDLEYIQKRSLKLDLAVLVRTAWVVVRGTGC